MGHYQQWLHYREVDQHLQSQLETLERELAQLQEHTPSVSQSEQLSLDAISSEADLSEQGAFNGSLLAENKIIQALATNLNGHSSAVETTHEATRASDIEQPFPSVPDTSRESISPALFASSSLPNFASPDVHIAASTTSFRSFNPNIQQPVPSIPHEETALLPEDMLSFIDEHTLTDPQLELPWWLRNIAAASRAHQSNGPIDQESLRTNRLVQRWLERWGRQPSQPGSHGENNNE